MKKLVVLIITIMTMTAVNTNAQNPDGKSILIYTRNGEGYVHDNIEASVKALNEICEEMGVATEHSDDPSVFENRRRLMEFDGIIFSNSNNKAFLTQEQRDNFQAYIRSGKAFMGVHSANASERDWPWFRQMIGGRFVRHPELQEFDINVIDPGHLSTKHLPAIWKWEDECYYSDYLNPAIHVLLVADLATVEDDQKSEYPGYVFGEQFPLAWYHTFEGSKVFFTALGHKIEYYNDANFRKHLEGGIRWMLEE
ncbi:MAG: ThuA domain-containing protein [Bacteroidales bacterium]|nr:ThuA domain-containing protein [Bacteroidales bacterium]